MADPKRDEPKTVTIDIATLNELIDAKARAVIAEAQAKGVVEGDDFERAMRAIRGQDKPAPKVWLEECESPATGARFKAKIMASRMTPLGRVIDLEDYVFPDGANKPVSQGGLMPDEFAAAIEAPESNAAIVSKYKHWLYWEIELKDRQAYASGKAFSRHILRSEADRRRAIDAEAVKQLTPVAAE